jgi:lipoprotein NlpD
VADHTTAVSSEPLAAIPAEVASAAIPTPVPANPVAAAPAAAAAAPAAVPIASTATSPTGGTLSSIIDTAAATLARDGVVWRWPTAGKIIGRFVLGDPVQQGIDLAGVVGQPVLAAADGEVVYSGDGLLGYGELVIVKHSPDYLSAYGHNQRRLAVEGDQVKAGQVIAELGQRGSLSLLHFEIRKQGKPVDPLLYLPPR